MTISLVQADLSYWTAVAMRQPDHPRWALCRAGPAVSTLVISGAELCGIKGSIQRCGARATRQARKGERLARAAPGTGRSRCQAVRSSFPDCSSSSSPRSQGSRPRLSSLSPPGPVVLARLTAASAARSAAARDKDRSSVPTHRINLTGLAGHESLRGRQAPALRASSTVRKARRAPPSA